MTTLKEALMILAMLAALFALGPLFAPIDGPLVDPDEAARLQVPESLGELNAEYDALSRQLASDDDLIDADARDDLEDRRRELGRRMGGDR